MELKSEDSLSETEKRIKQALIQKGGIKWLESEIQAHMRKALHGNENLILEK
jgi:pyruvate-formate lyase